MLQSIELLDRELLLWINHNNYAWLDSVMILATNRFFWIWMYILFAFLFYKKWKWKGLALIVAIFGVVILVDLTSVQAFKNVFQRFRPCHNLEIKELLHLPLKRCGGMFGFVSSHAANTSALAGMLLFLKTPSFFPKIKNLLLGVIIAYVILNCYSRMYLGVHYPLDILGGIILGLTTSFICAKIILKIPFFSFTKNKQ